MPEGEHPRVTDPDAPTSFETAIPVRSVGEEYAYLGLLECACGETGKFELEMQALMQHEGSQFDQLDCKCASCGAEHSFFFNVDAVFAGYQSMMANALNQRRAAGVLQPEQPPAAEPARETQAQVPPPRDEEPQAARETPPAETPEKRGGCMAGLLPLLAMLGIVAALWPG